MRKYLNKQGHSGVQAYQSGADFIKVKFTNGPTYLYTYKSAGMHNIEQMKELASAGKGLSTFISQHVKEQYEKML